MSLFESYLREIEERKAMGLHPKPIDNEALTVEIISQIKVELKLQLILIGKMVFSSVHRFFIFYLFFIN